MKYLVWVISGINLYFGFRAFLNAIHVLQTSKYSQATTVVFAILFLGLGAYGVYAARTNVNPRTGLLIGIGPWVLALAVLFITLVTSNPQ